MKCQFSLSEKETIFQSRAALLVPAQNLALLQKVCKNLKK